MFGLSKLEDLLFLSISVFFFLKNLFWVGCFLRSSAGNLKRYRNCSHGLVAVDISFDHIDYMNFFNN